MSKVESISLLKEISKINSQIDELKAKKYETQKKVEEKCNTEGHLMVCCSIIEEYDYDQKFIGTNYYSKCLICGQTKSDYYHDLYKNQINNGLYECRYIKKIIIAITNSNMDEANMFFKEECKFNESVEKLEYMSKILKEIGYTIDLDTKSIIPIKE